MFDWVYHTPLKRLKLSRWHKGWPNHCDCYNLQRFLFSFKTVLSCFHIQHYYEHSLLCLKFFPYASNKRILYGPKQNLLFSNCLLHVFFNLHRMCLQERQNFSKHQDFYSKKEFWALNFCTTSLCLPKRALVEDENLQGRKKATFTWFPLMMMLKFFEHMI